MFAIVVGTVLTLVPRIQEEVDQKESGRVPRTVEVELTEDLVDTCVPGDIVTVSGIVKSVSVEAEKGDYTTLQQQLQ